MSGGTQTPGPSKNEIFEQELAKFEQTKRIHVNGEKIDYARQQIILIDQNLSQLQAQVDQYQKDVDLIEVVRGRKTGNVIEGIPKELQASISKLAKKRGSISDLIQAYEKIPNVTREQRVEIVLHGHVVKIAASPQKESEEKLEEGIEFDIPARFLQDDTIMDALKKHGTIRGEKVTLLNTKVIEKFNKFKSILNFAFDVERNEDTQEISKEGKTKLKQNYVFLINEGSKWLGEDIREILTYRLAEAVYNDVIRMDSIIERNGATGEYTIRNINTGKLAPSNPYLPLLRKANTRNLIDVVRVSSMIDKNFVLNDYDLIGDAPLVKHLLMEHRIKDKSGERIQQARLLLLDKTHALKQIDAAIKAVTKGKDTSAQAYQELTFLKEYVTDGEIDRQDYMRSVLREVNNYKDFTEQNALIGGYTEKQIADMSEKDAVDIAANALREGRPLIAIFGLLALFAKEKKLAFGAFTLAIFGGAIADGVDATKRGAKGLGVVSDDMLDLVKLSDITYTLDREKYYQEKFTKLADKNREFGDKRIDSNNATLPHLDNKKLFKITDFITSEGIDTEMDESSTETVKNLKSAITAAGATLPTGITDEELKTFIKILQKSGLGESDDTTVLDYFSKGLDEANKDYESVTFIGILPGVFNPGVNIFNTELNTIFRKEHVATGNDRGERRRLIRVRDDVENILDNRATPIADRAGDVDAALRKYNATIADDVKDTLDAYTAYREASKEIDGYTGIWQGNQETIRTKIADAMGIVDSSRGEAWKTSLSIGMGEKIKKLEAIKASIPATYATRNEFKELITEIDSIIGKLTVQRDALANELNISNLNNILPDATILAHFNDGNPTGNGIKLANLDNDIKDDLDTLNHFSTIGRIDINNLGRIETEYKRLGAYSNALATGTPASAGASAGTPVIANHPDARGIIHQQNIINNLDLFTKTGGIKEKIKTHIDTELTNKFAGYKNTQDSLNSINVNDLNLGMATIESAETFLKDEVQYQNILANIASHSSAMDTAINSLGGLTSTPGQIWSRVKAGMGTIAFVTGTLDDIQRLGDKFEELRQAGVNPSAITQAQAALDAMQKEIEAIMETDDKNKELMLKIQDVLGSTISVPGSSITLESIRVDTIKAKNDLKIAAQAHLSGIDVSVLISPTDKTDALASITEIETWFFDDAGMMTQAADLKNEILLSRQLKDFPGMFDPNLPDAVTKDKDQVTAQITVESDPIKNQVLVEVESYLDEIVNGNHPDLTVKEFQDTIEQIVISTAGTQAGDIWSNYIWTYITHIPTLTNN